MRRESTERSDVNTYKKTTRGDNERPTSSQVETQPQTKGVDGTKKTENRGIKKKGGGYEPEGKKSGKKKGVVRANQKARLKTWSSAQHEKERGVSKQRK